ncbi:MAG: hypothetical protein RL557_998 [archaeon]|jgi:ubiquinone/menaquinone biosynthesis C-methylase UbiE
MENNKLIELDKLHSESEIYKVGSKVYDSFSSAEDYPEKISKFLSNKVKDKIVLDFGCGTGKFIQSIAPLSKLFIAMDVADNQLKFAKEKIKESNKVKFIKNTPNKIPLESNSVDVIFSAWVIGGIHNLKIRKSLLEEMKRVLKKDGKIYLIENDVEGDYKKIVEENHGNQKTEQKLKWLEEHHFRKIESFQTYFQFETLNKAREIFEKIFGEDIASKIKNKKISHNIVIYENGK